MLLLSMFKIKKFKFTLKSIKKQLKIIKHPFERPSEELEGGFLNVLKQPFFEQLLSINLSDEFQRKTRQKRRKLYEKALKS